MPDTTGTVFDESPAGTTRDEIIARLVVDELYWDPRVDASKVQVEVTDGLVTLTGRVPTVADRYSAEADARMIKGVRAVENRIDVDAFQSIPDAEITDYVTKVLEWAPDLDATDIEASVSHGTVTLRGTVKLYWDKLRARLLVERSKGVTRVVDELVVTPGQTLSDHEIAKTLVKALERRLLDDINAIQVTVTDGKVNLRGSVANAALREAAGRAAELTAGVVDVRNELTFPDVARSSASER